MPDSGLDIARLLNDARQGDSQARQALLERFRPRLKRLIALRLDRRIAARIDPSDVIQEVLLRANNRLSDYLSRQSLPFYPWLRQIAWERLIDIHRHHLQAQRRSVRREQPDVLTLPEDSVLELARRLVSDSPGPSARLIQTELRFRVRVALTRLEPNDREILVLRYLEEMTSQEVAVVLGLREGTAKVRVLRALKRLRELLADGNNSDLESPP